MKSGEDGIRILSVWLIEGSRGGPTRAKILKLLKEKPHNTHQIAKALNLNYRTVMHHLEVLSRHGLVVKLSNNYGAPYILSPMARRHWNIIEESIRRVDGDKQ